MLPTSLSAVPFSLFGGNGPTETVAKPCSNKCFAFPPSSPAPAPTLTPSLADPVPGPAAYGADLIPPTVPVGETVSEDATPLGVVVELAVWPWYD